jgi:membrane protein DedA with SNARE-associated domain
MGISSRQSVCNAHRIAARLQARDSTTGKPLTMRSNQRRLTGLFFWLVLLALTGGVAADTTRGQLADQPETDAAPTAQEPAHPFDHRLLRDIKESVARVEPWLERYSYGAVFVAVGVEGFGVPAPGQTILEAGSAASAAANARLRIGWILLVAFLATSLGNTLGYLIGRSGGRELLHRLRVNPRHLDKMERHFDRHGAWLIVFARFFDGPRQLNGIAAGILGMPWERFTVYNLAGAALWACFWGLGVYYLDLHLDQVVALIRHINPWVAMATLIGLGVVGVWIWRGSSRRDKTNP